MIITYLKLFCTFAKIGMFTIGGGYAMIPLIEREIDKGKNWKMSKDEFIGNVCLDSIVARSFCGKYIHFRGI